MLNRDYIIELSKHPSDISEHLVRLYDEVVKLNARVVVELGAGNSTYALLAGVNKTGGILYSIDIVPGGRNNVSFNNFPKDEIVGHYQAICGDDLEVARGWDREMDLLFIDTSHTYEHTKEELEAWLCWLSKGDVCIMHDTDGVNPENTGCRQALDEYLEQNKGRFEVEHLPNCNGLSILRKL